LVLGSHWYSWKQMSTLDKEQLSCKPSANEIKTAIFFLMIQNFSCLLSLLIIKILQTPTASFVMDLIIFKHANVRNNAKNNPTSRQQFTICCKKITISHIFVSFNLANFRVETSKSCSYTFVLGV
jgi:hypothetical protein